MEIVNRIRHLTQDIQTAASEWNGKEIIRLQGREMILPDVYQTILSAVDTYDRVERSPHRRVEVLGDLSNALRRLATRVGGVKSSPQKMLACANIGLSEPEKRLWTYINEIEVYRDKKTRFFLIRVIHAIWECFAKSICRLTLWAYSNDPSYQFRECAFRTVKNVGTLEGLFLDPKIHGAPPTLPYRSIQRDLEQFIGEQGSSLWAEEVGQIRVVLEQLKGAEEISFDQMWTAFAGKLHSAETLEEKVADLAYKIEKRVGRLRVGQSLPLPSGYVNEKIGHGIVIEILRTSPSAFQLAIYNTGDGADLGQGLWGTLQMFLWDWKTAVVAFQNLSEEAVSDQSFLVDLLHFMIDRTSETKSMNALFSKIQEHCVNRHHATQARLHRHELQSWGTCAYDSIRSYLKAKLEPSLFDRLEAYTTRKAYQQLRELFPQMRQSRAFNPATLDLFERKAQEAVAMVG